MISASTLAVVPSDVRMLAIHEHARALAAARDDVPGLFEALARSLTTHLCDGCTIVYGAVRVSRDVEKPEAHRVFPFPGGHVVATRSSASSAFEEADLAAIATCTEYTWLAAERATELANERALVRVERARAARFQHELQCIVGHDLRGPLEAILLGTEMLVLQNSPPAVSRIASFAKRMKRIVDRVLDLTRLRLGDGIPLARSPTRLAPLLTAAIAELARSHPASRVELHDESDSRGLWDGDRLAQVLGCVLSNAVQYGPEGGLVRVEVTRSRGVTRLAVHNDVDSALDSDLFATLLEPPADAHATRGLGLQISHAIVRGHGGTLEIHASPSAAVVEIALPDA